MQQRRRLIEKRVLPCGWRDAIRQLAPFLGSVDRGSGAKPFDHAIRIIDFEPVLHIFVEPSIRVNGWQLPGQRLPRVAPDGLSFDQATR